MRTRYKGLEPRMIGQLVTLFGIAFSLALAGPAGAKEGFTSSLASAPTAVKAAWPKTFAALTEYPEKFNIGTASLVWKVKTDSKWHLYFLTASHVVDQKCEVGKACANTYLINNLTGKMMNSSLAPDPIEWPSFDHVEVIDRSKYLDLAILRASVPLSATGIPEAMSLPLTCELLPGQPLYTVGYPATNDRVDSATAPLAEKDVMQKRWSSGIFIANNDDGNASDVPIYFGTTIDALRGNSGGPVVSEDGRIVGVLIKISGQSGQNGFRYDGEETSGSLDWHSISIGCEYLRDLKDYFQNKVGSGHSTS